MKKSDRKKFIKAYYSIREDKQTTLTVTKSELKEAFSSYENFRKFLLDKFGVDINYFEYLERISNDDEE